MVPQDDQIISGCIKGDRLSQKALFEKYASVLLGICMRYSKNKMEAEDILHEGLIKIFSNIDKFRNEGSFEGWMKRIIVNTALQQIQFNNLHNAMEDFDNINENDILTFENEEDDEPSLNEISLTPEQAMEAVQQLPEGYRAVMNLYVFEKYKHKEIAQMLNITENTSKSQLRKARQFLKNKLIQEKQTTEQYK